MPDATIIIAELLACSPTQLNADSALGVTPQWDSLAHVNIMLYLQQNYAVEISEETMNLYKTLSAIQTLIESSDN